MQTVKRRLVTAALAGAAVLCVTAAVPPTSLAWVETAREQREAMRNEIDALQEVQTLLVDAETGQRGFIISGDEQFLEPYNLAMARLPAALDAVAQLLGTDHNADRRELVEKLIDAARLKQESLTSSVDVRRRDGIESAEAVVKSGAGKLYMDEVRRLVRHLCEGDEAALLNMDRALSVKVYGAIGFSLTCALIVFGLFGATSRWMWRAIVEREQATRAARDTSAQLEIGMQALEALNGEMRSLSDMSNVLQTEMTLAEALLVASQYCAALLPRTRGAMYLFRNSADLLVRSSAWGMDETECEEWAPLHLEPRACWGLRRGQGHVVSNPAAGGLTCAHTAAVAREEPSGASFCLPLMAYGEMLGLLTVHMPDAAQAGEVQRIARTIGENVSLSLSNAKLRQVLRDQSIKDPLTGLFNRRYLEETLAREVARAQRTNAPLAVVVADLDHFKRINDTHGHPAGDAVLKAAAQALQRSIRASDLACRFGGEEFVLLLPDCPPEAAAAKAQGICDTLRTIVCHEGGAIIGITASFGVAVFPGDGADGAQLLKQADLALYEAKRQGRDRVVQVQALQGQHRHSHSAVTV